jgi:predicted glycogen debranching enzyme
MEDYCHGEDFVSAVIRQQPDIRKNKRGQKMITFDQETCRNLDVASQKEWLETNGLGGFASSTITGLNTRRYHGLLIAVTKPPVGRLALLSKLEETLVIDGKRFDLSANQYPGAIHPQGHQYLKQFRLDPFPVFTYEVEGVEIEKSVFMIHGENSTVIQYELRGAPPSCILEVRPLIAFRDYHSMMHENGALRPHVEVEQNMATVRPYDGVPALHLAHDADDLDVNGWWYRNFEYQVERERGLDFHEDLFSPCALRFDLSRRTQAAIIASTERLDINCAADYRQAEVNRRQATLAAYPEADEFVRALVTAADQFIVARGDQKTVIAGYHWFGDWGRDTMIALPGLTLVTGRPEAARSILLAFAHFVDRGMLPNRFPDAGEEPEYNTVDATLWYFEAVRALLRYTGDYKFVQTELYPLLTEIIDWHERGTRYGIRAREDGLLHSGEPGVQLTWMDARVDGREITPRTGKAVEIQALWYNALCVMEHLADKFDDKAGNKRYGQMAARARQSFNQLFWNEAAGCLFDVVDGEARDGSIRPNQILAVSLSNTMLPREKARQVVEVVERDLLTPYGLRSLSPNDPQYCGRYKGGPSERDGVYHQGTVWAWLMGPFITAYLKVNGNGKKGRGQAAQWLEAFNGHLSDAGLGQVSEVFDGDGPHLPGGCIAQAWSVAELLRAAVEDVYRLSR